MTKSEGSRLAPTSAGSLAGNGVLQPLLERLKRLEGLACRSLDKRKSGNGRSAPKGIRQTSRVALFATALDWLMTRGVGRWSWTMKKSGSAHLTATISKQNNKQKREIIDFPLLLIVEKPLPSIDFEQLAAHLRIHVHARVFS